MLTRLVAAVSPVGACLPASEVQLHVREQAGPVQSSVEWQCPASDCDELQSACVHCRHDDVKLRPTSPSTTADR